MDDKLASALANIKLRLKDFTASPESLDLFCCDTDRISVDRHQFPVPHLLLYILNGICGFPLDWPGEKTHWVVSFKFKHTNCAISYEKFGVRFYFEKNNDSDFKPKVILGKLQKAIESAEKHILSDLAQKQIEQGNITIANRFHMIEGQYQYFRNQAMIEYSSSKTNNNTPNGVNGLSDLLNNNFCAIRNGGFNALAMIDAYFSRLEHFFVLALPFSNYNRHSDNLIDFVGSIWSDKLRRILDINEPRVQKFYDQLVRVKEKYRNTFAHGGFEKSGQSFYFHLPEFAAIPASMSGHRESVHFAFFPIDKEGYEEICALFDEFDIFLKTVCLPTAWQFVDSGLDLVLEEKYLTAMLEASRNFKTFEDWLERQCRLSDMYDNAEY